MLQAEERVFNRRYETGEVHSGDHGIHTILFTPKTSGKTRLLPRLPLNAFYERQRVASSIGVHHCRPTPLNYSIMA